MNFNFSTHQDIKTAYKESPQKFSDKEIAEFPQNKVHPPQENIVEFFFFTTIFKNKQTKRKSKKKKKKRRVYLFI